MSGYFGVLYVRSDQNHRDAYSLRQFVRHGERLLTYDKFEVAAKAAQGMQKGVGYFHVPTVLPTLMLQAYLEGHDEKEAEADAVSALVDQVSLVRPINALYKECFNRWAFNLPQDNAPAVQLYHNGAGDPKWWDTEQAVTLLKALAADPEYVPRLDPRDAYFAGIQQILTDIVTKSILLPDADLKSYIRTLQRHAYGEETCDPVPDASR